jgi:hypothetical protein
MFVAREYSAYNKTMHWGWGEWAVSSEASTHPFAPVSVLAKLLLGLRNEVELPIG